MKLAVSSYSFKGEFSQFDCIEKAAEIGFVAIEYTDLTPPQGVSQMEYAKQIRKQCEKHNIVVSNYTIGADFLTGSNGNIDDEVVRVKKQVDIAKQLGTKSMRHDGSAGWGEKQEKSFEESIEIIAKGCRQVTQYAQQQGIKTMVENHGTYIQHSSRVEKLVKAVNHENFGWLVDVGNFMCVDQIPTEAVKVGVEYIVYAHAKDFELIKKQDIKPNQEGFLTTGGNMLIGKAIGEGQVNVKQCLKIIKESGYDGFLGLEYEGDEAALVGIKKGYDALSKYLKEI